jgi:predicted nuclease of predicted toxin-antitoxin system
MKLLLDECVPRKLKFAFIEAGYECSTVAEAGFAGKENGELLNLASGRFEVLITVDRNIRHQQKVTGLKIGLIVIRATSNDVDDIRPHFADIIRALKSIEPGRVIEVGQISPSR